MASPEKWAVGSEQQAVESGQHQEETLFLLSFAVATPLQWVTTVGAGSGE